MARLDEMFGGKGYYKGSTILCSGTAGTGKTSLAAHLVDSTCARGQRCLYFAFEESSAQLVRNMRSVGIDLARWIDDGKLRMVASRPHASGLETHLLHVHRHVDTFRPAVVVLDPITNLVAAGTAIDARSMLTRLIDFLKSRLITTFFTSLTTAGGEVETSDVGISSLIDTWVLLDVVRSGGERNRTLTIVKSRGMPHSNQATEYRLTSGGVELMDTYLGPSGVLTGSARLAKEAEDRAAAQAQQKELARKQTLRDRRRRAFEARLAEMRVEHETEDATLEREIEETVRQSEQRDAERTAMGRSRHAFAASSREGRRRGEGRRS
ncbi:MAG TPA: ATPase domain-containing protein [Anaeromyxobacter sp.]|nr:ATPase domain-containing protein [Anaeromyxobacter sp.]